MLHLGAINQSVSQCGEHSWIQLSTNLLQFPEKPNRPLQLQTVMLATANTMMSSSGMWKPHHNSGLWKHLNLATWATINQNTHQIDGWFCADSKSQPLSSQSQLV
jgi:hypothetical protein